MTLTGIVWSPANMDNVVETHSMPIGSTWKALKSIFGSEQENTITLTDEDCEKLDAMHAATDKEKSIYSELSELAMQYGAIEIKAW